jgi:CheY-like chemotaxis protein
MIVCVIEDLLFSIKISTAAKSLGVDLYFERSAGNVISTIREKRPALVIFDLNAARLGPIDAIAQLKSDEALKEIRTLGYVAHVDAETIASARAAGIDQVLARSAFASSLGQILTSA